MIKLVYKTIQLMILLNGLFPLLSCSSPTDSKLIHYINQIKAKKAQSIEAMPRFAVLPKFTFPEIDNRRSPFKRQEVNLKHRPIPDTKRTKQPLEKFPLNSLKWVGTLKQNSQIWALISQPGGGITKIKVGDYMGQNSGKIISINSKSLRLVESIRVSGKWRKQTATIKLNTRE